MSDATEHEWRRFRRVLEALSERPPSEVTIRIDGRQEKGENPFGTPPLEQGDLPEQPELLPGRRLANRYTIRKKIAQGGMGVVYEAVQELTRQEVAVKVINPAQFSPSLMDRFREEIRALGKLQHDHIVRVFDADYDRSDPLHPELLFYSMQLVEGRQLMAWVKESHPTTEARLECFIQICDAVEYAHSHGVIHRDLKPDNILVDASGRPAILDFGLARIRDLASDIAGEKLPSEGSQFTLVSGTPAFMSAERWLGCPGGVPADIFALGVILHQLLTDTTPWHLAPNESIQDALPRAICGFSPDQLRHHPALSRPLAHLLGSMLAPDPAERPASAAIVASTLRAVLTRIRLKRRLRRTAPIWAAAVLTLGPAIALLTYHGWRMKQARESEHSLVQAAQIVRQRSQADTLLQVIKLLPAKPALRHSQEQWRDVVWEAIATWNLSDALAVPLPAGFNPVAGTPQGTRFFGRLPAGPWDLIERTDGQWIPTSFPAQHDFLRVRINPRLPQLAALTSSNGLLVWQWKENSQTNLLPAAEAGTQFEFSPDGRHLACSLSLSGLQAADSEPLSAVRVFETETWKAVAQMFKPGGEPEPGTYVYVRSRPVSGLAFSPDGRRLATWSKDSSYLLIWDWSGERPVQSARHPDRLAGAAWRPGATGPEIATIQAGGKISVWKLSAAPEPGSYLDPANASDWGQVMGNFQGQLCWSPGGDALAAVDETNKTADVFAPDSGGDSFHLVLGHTGNHGMRWLCGGLVRSRESNLEWLPFDSEPPVRRIFRVAGFSPSHLAFHPSGTVLAAADNSRIVFFSTSSASVPAPIEMALTGPIAFDAVTGDLWAYNKTNGPIRWTGSATQDLAAYVALDRSVQQSHVGQLAACGGHLAFSRGTSIFVVEKDDPFDGSRAAPAFVVDTSPQQLAISSDGQRVAAIWWTPEVAAGLWRRGSTGGWVADPRITNAAVLVSVPDWNLASQLTLPPVQQWTPEEKGFDPKLNHFGGPALLVPAAQVPMIAWVREPNPGLHVDYLGPACCSHVGRLPLDRQPGQHTSIALSPDGRQVAAVSSKGEIHVWDLGLALKRLAGLRLGIPEIAAEAAGRNERLPKSTAAGPGLLKANH